MTSNCLNRPQMLTKAPLSTTILHWLAPFQLADKIVLYGPEGKRCNVTDQESKILIAGEWRSHNDGLVHILDNVSSSASDVRVFVRSDRSLGHHLKPVLDDPRVSKVFATNLDCRYRHPKLRVFPLGVRNMPTGKKHEDFTGEEAYHWHRKELLLCGGMGTTGAGQTSRQTKISHLVANGLKCGGFLRPNDYLHRMMRAKFVFSPIGNGIQNFRDWETLLYGAVPVMDDQPDCMKEVFRDLPVVFVRHWENVTIPFLNHAWKVITKRWKAGVYDMRRAHSPYWLHQLAF